MVFEWPQITLLAVMLLGLGVDLSASAKGTNREAWEFILIVVPRFAFIQVILYYGGFWTVG